MGYLVASWGTGKAEQNHLLKIIESGMFDHIILVSFSAADVPKAKENMEIVILDPQKAIVDLVTELTQKMAGKIKEFDAGINIVAGDGKLHMVIFSALLKNGLGIRLVAYTLDGPKEI